MKTKFIDKNYSDKPPKKIILSLGGFDGIHLGHQALIKKLVSSSSGQKASSGLCVFDPLPFQVLKGRKNFTRLFTIEETKKLLESLGLDFFYIIPFDFNFSKLRARDFIIFIVKHFNPAKIIIGYDFSFGFQREGNFSTLKKMALEFGFSVEQAAPYLHQGRPVSSSRIRKALSLADMDELKVLLGRPYSISGRVIKGEGRGRKLGFPTANLEWKNKEPPPLGVYGGRLKIKGFWHKALVNIGRRPSFASKNELILAEVYIPSGDFQLYDQDLTAELHFFVRSEKAFSRPSELQKAIKADILALKKSSF